MERLNFILDYVRTPDDMKTLLTGRRIFPSDEGPVLVVPPLMDLAGSMKPEGLSNVLEKARALGCEKYLSENVFNMCACIVEGDRIRYNVDGDIQPFWTKELGENVLHSLARMAFSYDPESDDGIKIRELIYDISRSGGDSSLKNQEGWTPYRLACVHGLFRSFGKETLIRDFNLFSPALPMDEFAVPDKDGNLLISIYLDGIKKTVLGMYESDEPEVFSCMFEDERFALRQLMDVYSQVEPHLPQNIQDENRLILSDALSHFVHYDAASELVQILVENGADPRYSAPGHAPAWLEAVTEHGFGKNRMAEFILFSSYKDEPPFVANMSDDELDQLKSCGHDIPLHIIKMIGQVWDTELAEEEIIR